MRPDTSAEARHICSMMAGDPLRGDKCWAVWYDGDRTLCR